MSRPVALLCSVLCSLLLAACGDDGGGSADEAEATPTPTPAATEEAAAGAGECEQAEDPGAKEVGEIKKPTLELDAAKTYVAEVTTNCGSFEITLDAERAPKTGGAFVTLARDGYFDDLTFHRIVPGFVIQGGDPEGTGTGGPGFKVVEAPPESLAYTKGVVAMAKAGNEAAGTSGSQFFVVTGEDVDLPPEYALLGKVTKGLEVAEAIGAVPTTPPDDRPVDPVVIEKVEIRGS
jgi:cyclophilin family peptidyl-prolyl cis-trans isomerase